MNKILIVLSIFLVFSCNSTAQNKKTKEVFEITKTKAEWKAQLSAAEYSVLREAGTERAFSSDYNTNKKTGIYVCKACETPLFKSENKYDSGSGWPSFDQEIKGNVAFSTDYDLGYARTEEHCATCGGHLGHVFNDGPKSTTGLRHCVNGVSILFIPEK